MISAVFMAAVLVALVAVLIGTRGPSFIPAAADCPTPFGIPSGPDPATPRGDLDRPPMA